MDTTTTNGGLIGTVNSWWSHPFNSGGSAFNWVMFVGVIIVAVFLWNLVLIDLTKEI